MKNVILITCWIAIAFIQPVAGQQAQERKTSDTLIIHLSGRNQVHIEGR